MSTVAEKVRAAADYIDRTGLHKGGLFDHEKAGLLSPSFKALASGFVTANNVPCCTVGALIAFTDEDTGFEVASKVSGTRAIGPWNDKPERTKEQVVARLRAVAGELERGE